GSGIGLAIAAELASAHGGALTADSQPGQGTRLTLTLPLALRQQREQPPARLREASASSAAGDPRRGAHTHPLAQVVVRPPAPVGAGGGATSRTRWRRWWCDLPHPLA